MIICVTGGRHFSDQEFVYNVFDAIHSIEGITLLVHGAARGVDALAARWAAKNSISHTDEKYAAEWEKFGKAAGAIRNAKMLKSEAIELLVKFPGGSGTANCFKLANKMGILTLDVEEYYL